MIRPLFVVVLLAGTTCSCTVSTTGGYLVGENNNKEFEGVHATVAEVLAPTLDKNECFLRESGQLKRFEISGELLETYSGEVSEKVSNEYVFANRCTWADQD